MRKDAFKALGLKTDPIDAIGGLNESDFPTNEVRKLEQSIREENRAYITFLEGMSSDIASIKQKVEGDTANKNDIAMLGQQMSEMVAAQEERVKDETQAHSNILESVSSGIGELKRKLDGEAANKEDISMLGKKIDDLKIAQEERDVEETKILEGISSDIDELRRKVGDDTATKDDITMLEHTIVDSLKAAHEKRNTRLKNSGNSSLATACLRTTQGEGGKGKYIALSGCGAGSVYLEWLLIEIKSVALVPYWYLISRVFNFAFFAIVKKSRN